MIWPHCAESAVKSKPSTKHLTVLNVILRLVSKAVTAELCVTETIQKSSTKSYLHQRKPDHWTCWV